MKAVIKSLTAFKMTLALGIFLGAVVVFVVARNFILSRRYHYKELKALGLFRETTKTFTDSITGVVKERIVQSSVKVRWQKNQLIFYRYNLAFSVNQFEALRPNLEHIFQKKIEAISSEKSWFPFCQPKIILHTEAFEDVLFLEESPKDLKPGQYWAGKSSLGKDVILDSVEKFQFSIGILGQAANGKGNVIYSMVYWSEFFGHGLSDICHAAFFCARKFS
jgi:hypothetical protein